MAKVDERAAPKSRKACCLISEMLEEMGLNSRKARQAKRQALLGIMTFCQWQISRMDEAAETEPAEPRRRRGGRVKVV
ncbi:MAG: hypothetical protein ABI672_05500 [Vicinamibacteria bacterium]